MVKRKIIEINEKKCNGCGLCIPDCPEGAIQMIDGKARLISDLYCDGLGACIGSCPQNAIKIIGREAQPYNEKKVMKRIVKHGKNTIKAHLQHLKDHNETRYLNQAIEFLKQNNIENPLEDDKMQHVCPGSAMQDLRDKKANKKTSARQESELRQWPVQLSLLPPNAPFFENSHLLVAADCVPFANANFHSKLLNGKSLCIGCPKLDDIGEYQEKLTEMFKSNKIKSITVAIMEVPCCYGLYAAVEQAAKDSGKNIPIIQEIIGINGELK